MATKSDGIRWSQLKTQICDIYEKASAGISNEAELDKSVVNAFNNGGFDVFYGEQLKTIKPEKFDYILNPEDHPSDNLDYFDGEFVIHNTEQMAWQDYLNFYSGSGEYGVILLRKKNEHTNPHIQQAKLGTNIKTKRMKKQKLSQKANYVPNRMINEVEVERNGKVTFVDGANILDGVYVKKGVKYEGGGDIALAERGAKIYEEIYSSPRKLLVKELIEEVGSDKIVIKSNGDSRKFSNNITKNDKKYYAVFPAKITDKIEEGTSLLEENGDLLLFRNKFSTKAELLDKLNSVYGVKKFEDGGQMNETFPDVDGQDDISFMAGGKVKKRKFIDYDEYDYEDEEIFDEKPDLIVKNNVDDEWGDVKVWYVGKKTIVHAENDYGAPALQIEGIVKDKVELLSYAKGLAGTGEEGDVFADKISRKKSKTEKAKTKEEWMNWVLVRLGSNNHKGDYSASLTIHTDTQMAIDKTKYGDEGYAEIVATSELGKLLLEEGKAKITSKNKSYIEIDVDPMVVKLAKQGDAYINDVGLLVVDTEKAKRGTTIKNKQMAESTTKKRFDKMYKASKPGERKSKKFAKITMADGSTFRRRNANDSYPDGVPGGKNYTENRKNRTDKRVYLEEGGNIGEGMGTYESTLESNIEMGQGIEMAKRGKSIASRKRLAGAIKKDLQAEYRADLNKQLDANLKATHAGYRKSKKYAKIMKRDGTYFRRRNANDSYPDGVPGGSVYYEARPNRTDKRVFLEDGGNLPFEIGFVYNIGGL